MIRQSRMLLLEPEIHCSPLTGEPYIVFTLSYADKAAEFKEWLIIEDHKIKVNRKDSYLREIEDNKLKWVLRLKELSNEDLEKVFELIESLDLSKIALFD